MTSDRPFITRLQSIRGLAALMVAAFHSYNIIPSPPEQARFIRGVQNVIDGTGAVFVFFILSGYVLSLTLDRRPGFDWARCGAFLKRRIFRLYPAIFFTSTLILIYYACLFVPSRNPLMVDMGIVAPPLSVGDFIQNVLLLKVSLNGVTWSLQPELIFSVMLPLTYLATSRWPVLHAVLMIGMLIAYYARPAAMAHLDATTSPYLFLFMFYAGALAAFYRKALAAAYGQLPKIVLYLLVALAAGVCFSVPHFGGHYDYFTFAATFIVSVIAVDALPALFTFLDARAVVSLGNLSYSFYLLHLFCLKCCCLWLLGLLTKEFVVGHYWMTAFTLFTTSVALALPLAWVSYTLAERPFTSAGKR